MPWTSVEILCNSTSGSLCDHVLLHILGLEMGCLGHFGQLRSAVILQKKRKKKKAIFVCMQYPVRLIFFFLPLAVLCLFFCATYAYRV